MGLKARLTEDAYAALDSTAQGGYSKNGDGYVLQVDAVDGWALEDVGALRRAHARVKDERKTSIDELEAFKTQLGDRDLAAALDALGKVDEMATWTPEEKTKEQLALMRTQLEAAHKKIVGEKDALLERRERQIQKHVKEAYAQGCLSRADCTDEGREMLLPHLLGSMDVSEDADGDSFKFSIRNEISMKQGADGNFMDGNEYTESKLKERFPSAFKGTGAAGSGATGSGGGATGGAFTISEDSARNPKEYQRVRAAAEKAGSSVQVVG